MDAMPGKVELPEWSDCELACDEKQASALEEFIYEYEPSDGDGANEWRERLQRLLATSYGYTDDAPNTRQRAERAATRIFDYGESVQWGQQQQALVQAEIADIIAAEFEE